MNILTAEQFRGLVGHSAPASVSIVSPIHRHPPEAKEDQVRFKNLLDEAAGRLVEAGLRRPDAEQRLAAARTILFADLPHRPRDRSVAVYVGPDGPSPRAYEIPVAADPLVTVEPRFHLKPLAPLVMEAEPFYVLALGQRTVRLLEANRFGIRPLDLPEAPESIEEFTRMVQAEESLQFHTGTAGGRGRTRPAAFHGQGVGTDASSEKKRIREFCQAVARAVASRLAETRAPLILAAHEPLVGLFREANRYSGLADPVLSLDPDRADADRLHDEAVEALGPVLAAPAREDAERYHDRVGTGMATADVETILIAAIDRRVETLWVRAEATLWGRLDRKARTVTVHDRREPGDEELTNLAVVEVCRGDGQVYCVPGDRMPDDSPLTAIFRYPAPQ
jgi:hypothetical protein